MKVKKKFHYAGMDEADKAIFVECREPESVDDVTVVKGRRPRTGEPGPLGSKLVLMRQEGDHFMFDDLHDTSSHAGPAQVATPAYRNGWDAVFGSKGVN